MRVKPGRDRRGGGPSREAGNASYDVPRAEAAVDGRWLVVGRDGRLTAYARTGGGLLRWTEIRPGGPHWSGPDFFAAPDVTDVSLAQGADGYVHFVARRSRGAAGETATVDIAHAIQYQPGRPVTEWRSVGNPQRTAEKERRIGVPAAVVSRSGRVHVFVRNAGGGVCMRREAANGRWEPWRDLKGAKLRDGMAVAATGSGCADVLVPGDGSAARWRQSEPDGAVERCPDLTVAMADGSATALETAPERMTFYWTDPATGQLVAHRPDGLPVPLGGSRAEGRIAALRTPIDGYDCTVLAHRTLDGQVMLAACGTENEGAGLWWSPVGERCAQSPALARDAYGRVVVAFVDTAGALRVARQSPEPGLVMESATRV
ncbi:hypothetical protein [Streptomyces sp. NPDC012510]|jgi:hypothetical protein|uniref:hypothetical protein n=1 Tax=Streptomyces sp. NPDC012510 TaxID=3364838 RepID=UPI0036E679BF